MSKRNDLWFLCGLDEYFVCMGLCLLYVWLYCYELRIECMSVLCVIVYVIVSIFFNDVIVVIAMIIVVVVIAVMISIRIIIIYNLFAVMVVILNFYHYCDDYIINMILVYCIHEC